MIVRDKTHNKAEYKGRPCSASDKDCPCKSCYRPHDMRKNYKDKPKMRCKTDWNTGCPQPEPKPQHVTSPRGHKCKRFGEWT